jgi:hypothetical protein
MKSATVVLLLLITMMCTHASSHGTEAEETTLLAKSYATNDGIGSASGMTLGRKLTDSNHMMSVQQYRDFMGQFGRHP